MGLSTYKGIDSDKLVSVNEFLKLSASPFMNVDGSVTPKVFSVSPALLGVNFLVLSRLLVHIEDNGAITADDYGALATLSSGLRIQKTIGGITYNLDGGLPITGNTHWARLAFDMKEHVFGSGNNFVTARWTFGATGIPMILQGADVLFVTVNDDLTTLVEHTMLVQGYTHK